MKALFLDADNQHSWLHHLPETIEPEVLEKAREGLVRRKVTIHPSSGSPYQATRWVRPEDAKDARQVSIHAAVTSNPELSTALDTLVAAGGTPYLVGGGVRDALLGIPPKDFDIELFGLAPDAVEQVLREQLGAKGEQVGKAFGVFKVGNLDISLPRKEKKVGEGHRGFEIEADPNLPPADAARRRDFSINSLYFDVRSGKVRDFHGGLEDLRKGLIRHVDATTFVEDPLRVYRAAQFAARFGFKIAPETVELARSMDLSSLPKERVYEEFKKMLLKSKHPSIGLDALDAMGVLDRYYPELAATKTAMQRSDYHNEGSVYNHHKMAIDAAAQQMKDWPDEKDRLVVLLTTFIHDIGKPLFESQHEDGTIHHYGHETVGLEPAKAFLAKLTNEADVVHDVLWLIEHHLKPAQFLNSKAGGKAYRKLINQGGIRLATLLGEVSEADVTGRLHRYQDGTIVRPDAGAIDTYKANLRRIYEQAGGVTATGQLKPLISGDDVMQLLDMKPGKEVGRVLRDVQEQQEEGTLVDRESALDYLRQNWLEKAAPGLVQRPVEVHRGGKTFTRRQWIRPEEASSTQAASASVLQQGIIRRFDPKKYATQLKSAVNAANRRYRAAEKEYGDQADYLVEAFGFIGSIFKIASHRGQPSEVWHASVDEMGTIRALANTHTYGDTLMVDSVVVHPDDFQRSREGYGTRLMFDLLQQFVDSDYSRMSTVPLNRHVSKFYRRAGFQYDDFGFAIDKPRARAALEKYSRFLKKSSEGDWAELLELEYQTGLLAGTPEIPLEKAATDPLTGVLRAEYGYPIFTHSVEEAEEAIQNQDAGGGVATSATSGTPTYGKWEKELPKDWATKKTTPVQRQLFPSKSTPTRVVDAEMEGEGRWLAKLASWLEKEGQRAYHTHEDTLPPHPVAVKDHPKWLREHGQKGAPEKATTKPTKTMEEPAKDSTPQFTYAFGKAETTEKLQKMFYGLGSLMSYERKSVENIAESAVESGLNYAHFEGIRRITFTTGASLRLFGYGSAIAAYSPTSKEIKMARMGHTQEVLIHEIGHHVEDKLSPPLREEFRELYFKYAESLRAKKLALEETTHAGLRPYAMSNPTEFFAESFAMSLVAPEVMKKKYPDIFGYMKRVHEHVTGNPILKAEAPLDPEEWILDPAGIGQYDITMPPPLDEEEAEDPTEISKLDLWVEKAKAELLPKAVPVQHDDGEEATEEDPDEELDSEDYTEMELQKSYDTASLKIGNQVFRCEIADAPDKQWLGLAARPSLDNNSGMLFVFPNETIRIFHTKKMNFPLDFVWLDGNCNILGVTTNVEPGREVVRSPSPAQYVIELNGGALGDAEVPVGTAVLVEMAPASGLTLTKSLPYKAFSF